MAIEASTPETSLTAGRVPVDDVALHAAFQALSSTRLSGRFQQLRSSPAVYVDVAHNPQAAASLASVLHASRPRSAMNRAGKTWAVIAMMADKDISGVLHVLSAEVDSWCFCDLRDVPRAISAEGLAQIARQTGVIAAVAENGSIELSNQCTMTADGNCSCASVADALDHVLSHVGEHDRVIIAGSFYTVSAAFSYFGQ